MLLEELKIVSADFSFQEEREEYNEKQTSDANLKNNVGTQH